MQKNYITSDNDQHIVTIVDISYIYLEKM